MIFRLSPVIAAGLLLTQPAFPASAAEKHAHTPSGYHALWEEAVSTFSSDDAAGSMVLFRELTERTPDAAEAWFGLSWAAERSGELDQAQQQEEEVQQQLQQALDDIEEEEEQYQQLRQEELPVPLLPPPLVPLQVRYVSV